MIEYYNNGVLIRRGGILGCKSCCAASVLMGPPSSISTRLLCSVAKSAVYVQGVSEKNNHSPRFTTKNSRFTVLEQNSHFTVVSRLVKCLYFIKYNSDKTCPIFNNATINLIVTIYF